MGTARICAIILDYFGADKTNACLNSLIGQGIDTIYVVDNSTAQSASAALKDTVRSLTAAADYKVEIITAGKNLGFAKGVNFALLYDARASSPHDYYMLLNNDAVAGPSLVQELIKAIDQDPCIALVSPSVVSSSSEREWGIWYHRYLGFLLTHPGRFRFHYFTGCCLMFRRDLVDEHGLFDEAFFMYGEDVELGWRLTHQGRKMICAEEVFVEHEYGPSVDRTSLFYEYHMARGHLLLSCKTWEHSVEIPFLIIVKYCGLFCRAMFRAFRARSLVPLQALLIAAFPIRSLRPHA